MKPAPPSTTTAPPRVTLTPALAQAALADAYRDAALSEADMAGAVAMLEGIRPALTSGADLFEAWDTTSAAIGRSSPGPLRTVLCGLRDRLHAHLVAANLNDLRSLPADGNELAAAWLALTADALIQLRPDVVAAATSVEVPATVGDIARLLREHRSDLDRSDWGPCCAVFEAVARHALLPVPLAVSMAARCAEIQLYRLEDIAACRRWLERASEAGFDTAPLANAWGAYCLYQRNLEAARNHFLRAVRLDEKFAPPYVSLADSYEREDDTHAASTWYEAGMTNCPGDAWPYLQVLHFYTRPGQVQQHRNALPGLIELAITLSPYGIGDVYLHAAVTYQELGDTEASDSWFRQLRELDPGRTDVLIWKARVLAEHKECDQAVEQMRTAVDAASGSYDVCTVMAEVYQTCGRAQEAPAWLERALEVRPEAEARIRLLLAEACRQAGDLARAEDNLIRSLRLEPESPEAANGVAVIAEDRARDQEPDAAEAMLRRVADAVGPAWAAWHHNALGDLYFGRHDYARARDSYDKAIELRPDVALFHHSLSDALRELNRFDETRRAIADAFDRDHDTVWYRSSSGLVANAEANYFYDQQNYAVAIPLYQEAAWLRPRDRVIFTNLAGAWERLDDSARRQEALEGAQAALRTASELAPDQAAVAARLAGVTALLDAEPDFGQLAIDIPPTAYPARLVVARDLVPAATDPEGALSQEFLSTIAALRTRLRDDLNVVLPGITLADDMTLAPGTAQWELDSVTVDEITSPVGQRFSAGTAEDLDRAGLGADVRVPAQLADGRTGWWIAEQAWDRAEAAGLELCSRMTPVFAALAVAASANPHHMISIDSVATSLGDARSAEAPAELPGFTQALRLHVADGLPMTDVSVLWDTYRTQREAGASPTAAAVALRRLPGSLKRIGQWCQQRPTAWVGQELEDWLARHSIALDGGPVLSISASDAQHFPEPTEAMTQAAAQGSVLVTRDASLRPLLAWLLRDSQIVAQVIDESELPEGIRPESLDAPKPVTAAPGAQSPENVRA